MRIALVVQVPIEEPDRVSLSRDEDPQLRRAVDAELTELLLDDDFAESVDVLAVHGTLAERTTQVMTHVRA